MAKASLKDVAGKSSVQILTEIASSFTNKDEYLRYLEGVAMISFKDALCIVDEKNLNMSELNRAEFAFGRAAAFLMKQELDVQWRLNQIVCGREIL